MSEYADYYDVYAPGGMADDRNDEYDPEFRYPEGYCEHGQYVGGCGADLMCSWCESGISLAEAKRIVSAKRTALTRERANQAELVLAKLLRKHGIAVGGIHAAELAQESSYTVNPRSRYGRH